MKVSLAHQLLRDPSCVTPLAMLKQAATRADRWTRITATDAGGSVSSDMQSTAPLPAGVQDVVHAGQRESETR